MCRSLLFKFALSVGILAIPAQGRADGWLLERYSYGQLGYSYDDQDSRYQGSTQSALDLASVEARFQPVKFGKGITVYGSIEMELRRQTVFGNTYLLPSSTGRLYFTSGGAFHIGPAVEIRVGQYPFFDVQSATSAPEATVLRESLGGGLTLSYGFGRGGRGDLVRLGINALARYDSGTSVSFLPNPLQSSGGYEGEAFLTFTPSSNFMLEFRYREIQESYQWAPASGSSTPSSYSNLISVFDLTLGLRLF